MPFKDYMEESDNLKKVHGKVVYTPNGIDESLYNLRLTGEECRTKLSLPKDAYIILFLGSLVYRKGLHILVSAIRELVRQGTPVKLVLAGEGVMKNQLLSLSKRLGLSAHIQFPGFISEGTKPMLYNAADVFCLPSTLDLERFPITILEASAAGLPILVSNLQTYRGIITDGKNGVLALRGDEKYLSTKLLALLEDRNERRRLG